MKFLVLACLLLQAGIVSAQKTRVEVSAGQSLNDVMSPADIFQYPNFTKGIVLFKEGGRASANLNYNYLNREMQFISPQGDTLVVDQEDRLDKIIIGADTFYFNKKYYQHIAGVQDVRLVAHTYFGKSKHKLIGYGIDASTASVTTLSSLQMNYVQRSLKVDEDFILLRVTEYAIGKEGSDYSRLDKKTFLKLFPQYKEQINTYFQAHDVNFYKMADLQELMTFIRNLGQ